MQTGNRVENAIATKLNALRGQKLPTLKRGDVARYFPSSGNVYCNIIYRKKNKKNNYSIIISSMQLSNCSTLSKTEYTHYEAHKNACFIYLFINRFDISIYLLFETIRTYLII